MSFFEELKRRNVVRVGIAYVVVSWILLQMTDVFVELLDLSNDVGRLVILLLAIGFIPALIFAWAFEMTPEGVKREKDVDRTQSITSQTGRKLDFTIIGLLVVALVYFVWESRFADRSETGADPMQSAGNEVEITQPDEETSEQPSIAVLPFSNRSRLEDDEFFVEGVHDDLLTNLARIGSLKVISRTSVLRYQDTEKPITEIAEELGVSTIMEGAVQRSGNTVRVNVQLIDAKTDEHLWAEIFDRELTAENLFAIQSEISQKIANALQTTLTDAERDRINTMPTDNLEAYDAYVRARQLMATRESENLRQATEEFGLAVELDPQFALAWAGVSDSTYLYYLYGTFDRDQALAIMRDAVDKALAIDANLGEVYASKAKVHEMDWEWEDAEASYQKAIELSPNYATAYHWYSTFLARYPLRIEERIDRIRHSAELDPRSPIVAVALAGAYESQGSYSRAERQYLKVLELDSGFPNALGNLASLYQQTGRFDQALKYSRKAALQDPGNPDFLGQQAFIYLRVGEPEKAEKLLAQMEQMDPERIGNGFLQMWISASQKNMAGAREAVQWTLPRMRKVGAPLYFFGNFELIDGNVQKSREMYTESDPRWLQPESWRPLIEEHTSLGCFFSWILLATGDEELGTQLLEQTTAYLTEELPAVMEHSDNYGADLCHLTAGDKEKAYAVLETQINHNHLGFWHENLMLPMYNQILGEERLNRLTAEHDRLIAEQRELIRQLDEGTAL